MTDVTTRTTTAAAPSPRLWSRTVEVEAVAAGAVLAGGEWCWLGPSVELAGWGAATRLTLDDEAARAAAADRLARRFAAIVSDDTGTPGPVAFASLTFDPAATGSVLVIPRTVVRRRDGRAWLTVVGDRPVADDDLRLADPPPAPRPSPRVRYAGASAAEIGWLDAVDRAVRRIRAGDVEKVVLARDRQVYSEAPFDLVTLVTRLRDRFPDCFTFRVAGLVGASPELLIRRTGDRLRSLVLAGTARRGADDAEDRRLGDRLLASAKDLAEHRPAVASVHATLEPLTARLDVEDTPHLLRLANVMHLATSVTGTLVSSVDALTLAERLHPTAAVGGTPTARALELIAELETIDRGRYAGPVGWVDAAGDGELAIALRCAQVDGARARLFAGAGIVGDSLPESELEETRLKLRAMQSAF
ncbi:MAG TPA: isochorismate synthase [Euzebyales bacterium]|nr:isochorismate synthase [Euzebyales bacterium]